jgi:hypothetical protein
MLGILLVVIVAIVVLFLVWAIIYEAWASHEIWWGGVGYLLLFLSALLFFIFLC